MIRAVRSIISLDYCTLRYVEPDRSSETIHMSIYPIPSHPIPSHSNPTSAIPPHRRLNSKSDRLISIDMLELRPKCIGKQNMAFFRNDKVVSQVFFYDDVNRSYLPHRTLVARDNNINDLLAMMMVLMTMTYNTQQCPLKGVCSGCLAPSPLQTRTEMQYTR